MSYELLLCVFVIGLFMGITLASFYLIPLSVKKRKLRRPKVNGKPPGSRMIRNLRLQVKRLNRRDDL
jgi:hypothetical protein